MSSAVRASRAPEVAEPAPSLTAGRGRSEQRRPKGGRASHVGKTVVVLATSFAAFIAIGGWVFLRAIPAWNTADTFVADVPHSRATTPRAPPIARRLVWAVVDGLTYDVAASTETIVPIAEEGALRPMTAAFPTFTAGGIAAMFTGQSPRESGVRLNGAAVGTIGLDDVLHSAADVGIPIRVHVRTYWPFGNLARAPEQARITHGRLGALVDEAANALRESSGQAIDAIHLGEVDDEGHDAGWRSPGYREAALHAGAHLQRIISTLDPERDVLLAMSDHGHRGDGGHGGVEAPVQRAFFLAWGAAIRRGVELPERPLRDVASTVSALLGVHTPSSNMGVPMLDILDVDRAQRAALLAEPFDQLVAYDCAQAPDLAACADASTARGALAEGDDAEATRVVANLANGLDARRDAARASASLTRAVLAVLVAAIILGAASFARPSRRAAIALPVTALAPYFSVLLAMGYLPTLSKMTGTDVFATDAAWAGALSLPLVAFVAARHRVGLREVVWLEAVGLAIVVPLLVWAGADPRQTFDPLAGVLVFQLSPIALVTALSGVVILVTRAIFRRRAPSS